MDQSPRTITALLSWWHDGLHNVYWGKCVNHPFLKDGTLVHTARIESREVTSDYMLITDALGDVYLCNYQQQQVLPKDMYAGEPRPTATTGKDII